MGNRWGLPDRARVGLTGSRLSAVANNHNRLYRNEGLALVSVENKDYPVSLCRILETK